MKFRKDNYYIGRILKGDTNAYAALVNKHKDLVFTIAVRILKNREDAEELAQDVFIKAFKVLNTFKSKSKFSTWLYRITYNMAISKTRKKKLQTADLDSEIIENFSVDDVLPDLKTLNPEEQNFCLQKALKSLSDEGNLLITFFYYDGRTIEEISEITSLSYSNVKVKLHRSRKKLYSVMQKIMQEEINNEIVFENSVLNNQMYIKQ